MSVPSQTTDGGRRRGRLTLLVVVAGVVLMAGLYAATVWAVSSTDVPDGTSVRGVDIGGQTTQQAAATLAAELGAQAGAPIPVTLSGTTGELDPEQVGLGVDWEATAAQATGAVWTPRQLWQHLTGTVELDPVTTVDEAKLTAALRQLAKQTSSEPVEPTITFSKDAEATLTPGSAGETLQVQTAATLIADSYLVTPGATLALPVSTAEPFVSTTEAERVLTDFAEPAVAKSVTLRIDDEKVKVAAEDIAASLSFTPADGTLAPTLDATALHERLAGDLDPLERSGASARIVIRDGKPVIIKSRSGRTVDSEAMAAAVVAVLPQGAAADRVATVELVKTQPRFTTADAKALNIKQKLSSFRQWFPPAAYRWQNVGQAAAYLNGTILEPGETFSMNDTIHERTRANGYTEGFIISGGRFREELGGGVSIITTATWTAGFYAGLERVEQHPHGLYISRYKAGLEATVAWGALDLRMRNDTGNGVLITATRYSNGVLIEMWGKRKFDRVTASFSNRYGVTGFQTIKDDGARCVPSEGVVGFSISVTRRRYIDGEVVSKETWPTHYRPTPNVICTNPAADS